MGYKYDDAQILEVALDAVLEDGFARLTFSSVAKRMGINDRSIVYYFPTKTDLVARVFASLENHIRSSLSLAFDDERLSSDEFLRRSWATLATPETDATFALFFEVVGLATARVEPYDELVPLLVEGWNDWVAERLIGRSPEIRRQRAAAVNATFDGLMLTRLTAGPETAEMAARALKISSA